MAKVKMPLPIDKSVIFNKDDEKYILKFVRDWEIHSKSEFLADVIIAYYKDKEERDKETKELKAQIDTLKELIVKGNLDTARMVVESGRATRKALNNVEDNIKETVSSTMVSVSTVELEDTLKQYDEIVGMFKEIIVDQRRYTTTIAKSIGQLSNTTAYNKVDSDMFSEDDFIGLPGSDEINNKLSEVSLKEKEVEDKKKGFFKNFAINMR